MRLTAHPCTGGPSLVIICVYDVVGFSNGRLNIFQPIRKLDQKLLQTADHFRTFTENTFALIKVSFWVVLNGTKCK